MPGKRGINASSRVGGAAGPKKKARADAGGKPARREKEPVERMNDYFLADDAEERRKGEQEEAELDAEEELLMAETAEEKRLRLARAYLAQMTADVRGDDDRGSSGQSDDDGGDDEDLSADDEADPGVKAGRQRSGEKERLTARLKQDAAEVQGRLQRKLAHRVRLPEYCHTNTSASAPPPPCAKRGHNAPVCAVTLSNDERTAFTVAKDGGIFMWDVETMQRTALHRPGDKAASSSGRSHLPPPETLPATGKADWIKAAARVGSKAALYCAALSNDSHFLAVGGGDNKVYIFDGRSGTYIQSYPGHRDIVSGLAFRENTHQLYSASFDRTVKLWSLDDHAYVDTLYGHQGPVLALDALRNERVVSAGHDHTARVWKIPEESQLIFRAHNPTLDCIKYITGTEWVSGSCDGSLLVWSQTKKKPAWVVFGAHGEHGAAAVEQLSSPLAASAAAAVAAAQAAGRGAKGRPTPAAGSIGGGVSAGSVGGDAASWIQSVAVCRGSDLVASGAGDGVVRLWQVEQARSGGAGNLRCLGGLPTRGFVNGLAIAKSARFVLAATGQEPRLGRWARDGKAKNGLVLHQLNLTEDEGFS